MDEKHELLQQLAGNILDYDAEAAVQTAQAIVDAGLDIMAAVDAATAAIDSIGDQFESGDLYLPELMLAGDAMKRCMAVLSSHMGSEGGPKSRGKVVIGAVLGDIHDIGKNLVATQLLVKGFEVIDLGVGVAPLQFVDRAQAEQADIIALSSLMTTSMPYQRDVLQILAELGLRDKFYVIVGGGPVTPEYAREIGADAWASNALTAARLCERLLTVRPCMPVSPTMVQE